MFILSPENIGLTRHTPFLAIVYSLYDTLISNSPADTGFNVLYVWYRTAKQITSLPCAHKRKFKHFLCVKRFFHSYTTP